MFSLSPVKAENGEVVAILAFRLDGLHDFSSILRQGNNIGKTGESYVFDKAGRFLSESRYLEGLWKVGLLGLNEMSTFNLQLRDPGGNMMTGYRSDIPRLEQPLTLMAQNAIKGKDGQNLEGYNDYRGVPVIGAWHWSEALGMGVATEIDIEEVYTTLNLSRYLMVVGVVLTIVIIILLNIVYTVARKRVERSEASLLNAQCMAHLGSWERDLVRQRVEWSDETYRIFKQHPEQFEPTYEDFLNRVHPDDRERVIHAAEDALNNNKPYQIEHRIKCSDGSEKIVLQQAVIERDIHGNPTYMHGSVLDITDRKKAEQELTLFKTTLDMIEDSVFMFSPDSLKFFYVNQAAIEQLGYTEEELLNMTPVDIKPRFDHESFRIVLNTLIEDFDHTLVFQTVHQCKNGTRIPVDIALQYLVPKDEDPRFVAIARDFSKHQQTESQLKHEKDNAEQATRKKSEFLANMSHEIRTPMNGVLGMLELMDNTQLSEKQKKYLHTAESSAQSLLVIISDILDFSKIEAGHMQLEKTVFDLHKTVEDSVISMSKQAYAKQLDLNCYIAADVAPFVVGDPVRLRQVIINLLSNAIKFTATGEVNFRLGLLSENDEQITLCFEVEDTGVGVKEEMVDVLFEAFSQADGSTSRKYGGTGLGLSICKQLVSMMNGEINVSSKSGSGSIFSFSSVFSKVKQKMEPRKGTLPKNLRVLVVDDNDTNRAILSHYLSNWSVQHEGVGEIYDVLPMLRDAIANNRPYHVILLDFLMSKNDELKLAEKLKDDEELQNIRLIMLSSSGEGCGFTVECNSYGECNLTKPTRQSDLFEALLQVTGQVEHNKLTDRDKVAGKKARLAFSNARVLLVDDVLTNQVVGVEMLNELGIDPVLANDGRSALKATQNSDFDLIFMDCQMPIMDGYAATEIFRAQEWVDSSKHLPIVALTANAIKGDRDACISAGMDDYLAKPITLDKLYGMLVKWLPKELQREIVQGSNEAQYAGEEGSDAKISTVNSPTISNSVLDTKILNTLMKLAGKRFCALIDAFESDAGKNLPKLRDAIKRNDLNTIILAAHAMKGAGVNLAAIRFSECCKTLEMQARDNKIIDAQGQMKCIEDEYRIAISALSSFC